MSILKRQIVVGIAISLLIVVLVSASFITVFPIDNWELLWKRKIFDIPFILFVVSASLLFGTIFGIATGLFLKKELHLIEEVLQNVDGGQLYTEADSVKTPEIGVALAKIQKLQKHLAEQTKRSQVLATEKVEDQAKQIEEIILQERHRLARELHDSVSQQLFGASMLMSAITEASSEQSAVESKQLQLVEGMIQQSQLEMRALLLHLRPIALHDKSLQMGMEELLLELRQKVPMEITWKIEDFKVEKGIEDHLFRILQESVSNTLRHAKASTLDIYLMKRQQAILLHISDDGKGFDVSQAKVGSYGLQNMRERAIEIGGTLKIVSIPKQGTRIDVKVPIIEGEGEIDD